MTTHYDKIDRWFARITGETDKPLYSNSSGNVHCYDDTSHYGPGQRIDSYGSHFQLVYPLRTRAGRLRGFILNGDRYSNSTTRHQSEVRSLAQHYTGKYDLDLVIVPFDALASAGVVDYESIEVLDVTADRTERIHHSEPVPPGRFEWTNRGGEKVRYGWVIPNQAVRERADSYGLTPDPYRFPGERCEQDTPGATWGIYMETLPDAWVPTGVERVIFADGTTASWDNPLPAPPRFPQEATYEWTTFRHWLGESLIRAKVQYRKSNLQVGYRWAHFISGFDHNEPRPLYHLSELPGKGSRTIKEAYEELKPTTVRVAESEGREVKRQGDIFAVPTGFATRDLTRSGGVRVKRGRLHDTSHTATETVTLPSGVTLARGVMRHEPVEFWRRNRPDHVRVALGKQWHIVVKNTVPLAK